MDCNQWQGPNGGPVQQKCKKCVTDYYSTYNEGRPISNNNLSGHNMQCIIDKVNTKVQVFSLNSGKQWCVVSTCQCN